MFFDSKVCLIKDKNEYRKRMIQLKVYLEDSSVAELACDAELMKYFALPYIPDPQKIPIFREILQKNWVENLQKSLEKELVGLSLKASKPASTQRHLRTADELVRMLSGGTPHNETYRDVHTTYAEHDYNRLIDVADELIECLEKSSIHDREVRSV